MTAKMKDMEGIKAAWSADRYPWRPATDAYQVSNDKE